MTDARQAMLSRKKALLAAHLIDTYVDRLFAARNEPAADVLAFREALASAHPTLELVFALVAGRAELVTDAVEVPIAEYDKLSVEDFMVSLYNSHTVQRLRVVMAGNRRDVHEVLAEAVVALRS